MNTTKTNKSQLYNYTIREYGNGGPVIILLSSMHQDDQKLQEQISNFYAGQALDSESASKEFLSYPFVLITVKISCWNQDLSPWPALEQNAEFTGDGNQLASWMEHDLCEMIYERYGRNIPVYLIGYSLAGLFSLWFLLEKGCLQGAGSCSGSMWYPNFVQYAEKSEVSKKQIYISLGGKEGSQANGYMQSIEDDTQTVVNMLKTRNNVYYEKNPGGHFSNYEKRMIKCIRWLLEGEERSVKKEKEKTS